MPLTGFDHQISWGQFQKRNARPEGGDEDAEIHTSASVSYDYRQRNGNYSIAAVRIGVAVNSSQSWVVRSAQTRDLLKHEQGHFDIQALGAREQFNRLRNLSEPSLRELEASIREINIEVQRKINDINIRYDNETDHSRNQSQQRSWDTRLNAAKSSQSGTLDSL